MITGELKAKIDRVWDAFWSGSISNPLEMIDDPACGTAGFLVAAGEYVRDTHPTVLTDAKQLEHHHHKQSSARTPGFPQRSCSTPRRGSAAPTTPGSTTSAPTASPSTTSATRSRRTTCPTC